MWFAARIAPGGRHTAEVPEIGFGTASELDRKYSTTTQSRIRKPRSFGVCRRDDGAQLHAAVAAAVPWSCCARKPISRSTLRFRVATSPLTSVTAKAAKSGQTNGPDPALATPYQPSDKKRSAAGQDARPMLWTNADTLAVTA